RMDVREFEFDLPAELIAQEPAADRSGARLLQLDRSTGAITHAMVAALPSLLRPGDLIVVNNTRAFPARLLGRRVPSDGAVECLLMAGVSDESGVRVHSAPALQPRAPHPHAGADLWEALVHPGQKLKPGARVVCEGVRTLHGEILERRFFGRRLVRLWTEDGCSVDEAIDAIGHVPLPPYIKRRDT